MEAEVAQQEVIPEVNEDLEMSLPNDSQVEADGDDDDEANVTNSSEDEQWVAEDGNGGGEQGNLSQVGSFNSDGSVGGNDA